MTIRARQKGLYLEIDPQCLLALGNRGVEQITKAATITIMEAGATPNDPPIQREVALWSIHENSLRIPLGVLKKIPNADSWDIIAGQDGEHIAMTLRPLERFPVKLEKAQLEILDDLKSAGCSGSIEAAMGAGKSWLVLALILGNPLLRPAAISGKGEKDTKQLIEKIKSLNQTHPDYAEPVIVSGLGRQLSKKDKKILESGQGIIICTHAGLQNLPSNTKLLVLDEGHAAATTKRIGQILKLTNLIKAYSLTGTSGLRGDGGDELLSCLIGPPLSKKGHEHFEATGRVAPALIQGYHFTGKGIYAENPFMPDQTPQEGYSLHSTWIENHRGRHLFVADLILSLPPKETKVIFVPHIIHAVRISKAIELRIKEKLGDISFEDREKLKPTIFHARADKSDRFYMSKEERERRVQLLKEGKIKLAVATDFLSTGFDTNMIDHVIDASGQKAIITNIQRSGRGSRPRIKEDGSLKITQIHTIMDKTHPVLHKLGEKRFLALGAYYNHKEGIPNPERLGGIVRLIDPPWIAQEDRATKVHGKSANHTFSQIAQSSFDPQDFASKALKESLRESLREKLSTETLNK